MHWRKLVRKQNELLSSVLIVNKQNVVARSKVVTMGGFWPPAIKKWLGVAVRNICFSLYPTNSKENEDSKYTNINIYSAIVYTHDSPHLYVTSL